MFIYTIRNNEGRYFKPRAGHSHANQWVDWSEGPKLYTKKSYAKARQTFYTKIGRNVEIVIFKLTEIKEGDINECNN